MKIFEKKKQRQNLIKINPITHQIAPFKINSRGSMSPNPLAMRICHAQHVASQHANSQIRKKILGPPPNPGDAPDRPHSDPFLRILYAVPIDQFLRLLYMGAPQISIFAYYMGAPSDLFLCLRTLGGLFGSVLSHTIWGSPQINFFAYTTWGPALRPVSSHTIYRIETHQISFFT